MPSTRHGESGNLSDTDYNPVSPHEGELVKVRRQLRSIQQSPSFVIAQHLAESYSSVWKLISLPISLPILAYKIITRKNITKNPDKITDIPISSNLSKRRNSIVFFPTNGVGFGHFTRTLAIARRLKKLDGNLEIVFVTTMPTLHPLSDEGFLTYHLPPRYRYDDLEPRIWNNLIEELLGLVFSLHNPKMFLFDGAFPYRGMLNSIKDTTNVDKIWIRRGTFRKDVKTIPSESINHFDAIIRPGDSISEESISEIEHDAAEIRCNPIVLLDEDEMRGRGELRRRLGIPKSAVVCYLQLGAGKINDISDEIQFSLDALSKHSEVYTVVGESILGERITFNRESVRVLRDYPNSMFLLDFDFAIMAGGYNSYHEAIQASLPTLCYPNMKTSTDDQLARAMVAHEAGCMIVLKDRRRTMVEAAIDRICDSEVRDNMKAKFKPLQRDNGATQISQWIVDNY